MIERATMNEVTRSLVEAAQADIVGLWTVLWDIELDVPDVTPEQARQATLAIVRDALAEGTVVAGELVDQDEETAAFVPWRLSVDETVARIEQEWLTLGRKPNPGEIAWFVAPCLLPVTVDKHPMGKGWQPRQT